MKKKAGFTLVELLAVIVILAVIALIALPILLNVIEDSKQGAALRSAEGYLEAIEKYNVISYINNKEPKVGENLDVKKNLNDIKVNGTSPASGKVTATVKEVTYASLCISNYQVTYSNNKYTIEKECEDPNGITKVSDSNPGILFGNGTEEDYDNFNEATIKSIDDLIAFSKLSETKDFSGKTIKLEKSLDFNSDKSYVDKSKKATILSNGFTPINSSSTVTFKGTFYGQANKIINLKIKGNNDYAGLFGYINGGTIKGITLENVDVTGKDYVGGLIGYSAGYGTIWESKVSGKVTGNNSVGGLVGASQSYVKGSIVNVSVTGNNYVGGLVGTIVDGTVQGIVESGTISATGNSIGKLAGYGTTVTGSAAYEEVTLNKTKGTSSDDGVTLDNTMIKDISYYNKVLDTFIGGDDDSSGYYFDYDIDNDIVIKKADNLTIDLKGSGTAQDPYLIETTEDMKYLSLYPAQSNHYKLMNDLDYTNKKFYMIGTNNTPFQGSFDGNMKTISNVTLSGNDYVGMFGNVNNSSSIIEGLTVRGLIVRASGNYAGMVGFLNRGIVKGITLENIDITGNNNVGGLVGGNSGNGFIYESKVSGNVGGNNYIGGIVGTNQNYMYGSIANVNVTGTNYVGGIVGYKSGGLVRGIVESGTISATGTNIGKLSGCGSMDTGSAAHEGVTLNKTKGASSDNGVNLDNDMLRDINYYDRVLDTYLAGDNNSGNGSGYYFDYENDEIVIKKVNNLTINLDGSGTAGDPYLIKNVNDMKYVSLYPAQSNHYKLMNDLDYTNKKFYMIGTNNTPFQGFFDGNMKTISNVNINSYDNAGIFGRITSSSSIIEGLTARNLKIKSIGNYAGMIGYNSGLIKGITLENVDVTGNDYVGGLAGYSDGYATIYESKVSGKVTGNNNVGGVVGYNRNYMYGSIANVNVTGNNYVGGIVGYKSSGYVIGIVEGGTTTGNTANTGKITGYGTTDQKSATYEGTVLNITSGITQSTGSQNGVSFDSSSLKNLTYYKTIVDTTDKDNNKYYFDTNSSNTDILIKKVG